MKLQNEPKSLRVEKVDLTKIRLFQGDITRVGGRVIVTPTNSTLDKLAVYRVLSWTLGEM